MAGDTDSWEVHAAWWQEGFTEGADPEYEEQILPLAAQLLVGSGRVVDLGTGEGQIARLAARLEIPIVVGIDPTQAQLRVARERAGGPVYVRGVAARLPFANGAFDAAIACLVFEHIEDYGEAIAEVARVLQLGGASSSSSTTRFSRRRAAGGSTTTSWKSSTGESAPTWWKTTPWRRSLRASFSHSSTGR